MSFVERRGLWSPGQKEAASRLRRDAPWPAPVPGEIAGKAQRLSAAA